MDGEICIKTFGELQGVTGYNGVMGGYNLQCTAMGPTKCGLILQGVLNKDHLLQKIALWDQIKGSNNQGWS